MSKLAIQIIINGSDLFDAKPVANKGPSRGGVQNEADHVRIVHIECFQRDLLALVEARSLCAEPLQGELQYVFVVMTKPAFFLYFILFYFYFISSTLLLVCLLTKGFYEDLIETKN